MLTQILPFFWLFAILLIHFLALISTRFTLWPEMLVYPYLLNHGFILYKDIINPYPPLLPNLLSIFTGQFTYGVLPVQILTWLTIIITDIAIFALSFKITKNRYLAFASLIFFVFFSIPFGINGIWFDLFQTLPCLLSTFYFYISLAENFGTHTEDESHEDTYLNIQKVRADVIQQSDVNLKRQNSSFKAGEVYSYLQKTKNNKNLILSFFFLGLAFAIKQQTIWLVAWFLLIGLLTLKSFKKNTVTFLLSALLPFTITIVFLTIIFLKQFALSDFLFWAVYFPFFKSSSQPGYVLLPKIMQSLVLLILVLTFAPLIIRKNLKESFLGFTAVILILFAYPRFDYFHLIPSLAIFSLVFGKNIQTLAKTGLKIKLISTAAILLLMVFSLRYFQRNWTTEVRFFEDDVYQAAKFMQIINPAKQPVFLQNVSGQILVISGNLPTKPWADSFPWYFEIPNIQENVISGIKNEDPSLVIYKPYQDRGKFDLASYRPKIIADFIEQNYTDSLSINNELILRTKNAR